MNIEHEIQRLIYSTLNDSDDLTSLLVNDGIVDHRAQQDDGADISAFPYITIGDDSFISADTDSTIGVIGTVKISVFSAKKGLAEVKSICNAVRDALERVELTSDYVDVIDLTIDKTEFINDIDGRIVRANIDVRIIADSVET